MILRLMCAAVVVLGMPRLSPAQSKVPTDDSLCGLNCLYVAMLAVDRDPGSYAAFIAKNQPVGATWSSLGELEVMAKGAGLHTLAVQTTTQDLARRTGQFACIAHVDGKHFVNVGGVENGGIWVIDPPIDAVVPASVFAQRWKGHALLLSRTPLAPLPASSGWGMGMWGLVIGASLGLLAIFAWLRRHGVSS